MIVEHAYAKVNLFLNVVGKRPDQYHNLEMIMVAINLSDSITIAKSDSSDIVVTSTKPITDDYTDNIVYKVAKYLQKTYREHEGVSIHIEKNIPIAAGLAGGSADAAATLRGLNELWELGLSLDQLAEIGLQFGSDIPFCIYNKLAKATGRGEQLFFLDNQLEIPLLLVNPNIPISTKNVFQHIRKCDGIKREIGDIIEELEGEDIHEIGRELYNSLEKIVFQLHPALEELKFQLQSFHPDGVLMSGSGATLFVMDSDPAKLENIKESLPKTYFTTLTKTR